MKNLKVAVAGNPNCGKTSLFNNLTGSHQSVGNWPGVTVEKREGLIKYKKLKINFIDLPGIYGLTTFSTDELIARNYLLKEKPDIVINIVDSTNLERSLYLTTQLIELGMTVILALNKRDLAKKRNIKINKGKLASYLGVKVVTLVASKNRGTKKILDKIYRIHNGKEQVNKVQIKHFKVIEDEIARIKDLINKDPELTDTYTARWLAIKLLEKDSFVRKNIKASKLYNEITETADKSMEFVKSSFNDEKETVIANSRYGFIASVIKESVYSKNTDFTKLSDIIDRFVTSKYLGIPVFLFFMWIIFQLVFNISSPAVNTLESFFNIAGESIIILFGKNIITKVIAEAIIGGVGSVIIYLPNILVLFLAVAVMEDSGYMTRVAFIMDRYMHKIGLHGKSFLPMILGFGCSIPAFMGSRIIENRKNRIVTMLVTPFMSCGAKLPVYILLIGTFFPGKWQGTILFMIYLTGVITAIAAGSFLKKYLLKGAPSHFIIELPPYKIPSIKNLLIHMWNKTWIYIKKAGSVILLASITIWILINYPVNNELNKNHTTLIRQIHSSYARGDISSIEMNKIISSLERKQSIKRVNSSFAGKIGHFIEPVIKPLGFDWKTGISIIAGIGGKEIIISTLSTIYSVSKQDHSGLRQALVDDPEFDLTVGMSLLAFTLFFIPCLPAILTFFKEVDLKWTLFMISYLTVSSYIFSFLVYQGGKIVQQHLL
ncbi:MAG: ferrous iron transport protein B [bacterium]|nr:ferrous iron transport protein B [bacterium]